MSRRSGGPEPAARVIHRPGRLLWLWAVWMLLWGRLTPLAALSGLLVAAVVLAAFPLRPVDPGARFRPLPALALLGHLVADLVPSAVVVAWQMIRYGPRTRSAIVAVPLGATSEVVSTLTANAVSLAPGAFVLEIDHEAGELYVYVLAAGDEPAADRTRAAVLGLQRRVLAAFGAAEGGQPPGRRRGRPRRRAGTDGTDSADGTEVPDQEVR
ncbi:Na+/H+ antiporter subunit E [Parafrankia discariae]|uniref:Na+/H+ antiporter subunit E n=1 Tax=Parafrankia discariae TaxID=365528 RepID=UPI0004783F79|nr:Na+/H+ antiporter subunit E [Parafrankia discariae]